MKKIHIYLIFIGLIALIFSATSCDKLNDLFRTKTFSQTQPVPERIEGTLLARVGPTVFTLEDFNTRVNNFNQISKDMQINSLDDKKSFLQTLIQQELFYQQALVSGLDKDPQINKAVAEFKKTLLVQKLITDQLVGVAVESKEIEAYYKMAKSNYRSPEEIKVSEIALANLDTARQILIQLLQGADFASLAQQHSKASSARSGGQLGWKKRGDRKIDRFDEVAFSLKKGEVSNVFQTSEGYFIVRVDDKRGGELKSISDVWDQVKEELLNYKQNQQIVDFERSLREKTKIEIHEELLR
jgi:parvulin-like peptidyl-prolyl isomerase